MRNIITNKLSHPQTVFNLFVERRQCGWVTICFERRLALQFDSIWIINRLLSWGYFILAAFSHWWLLSILYFTLVSSLFLCDSFAFVFSSIYFKLLFCLFSDVIRFIASFSEIWVIGYIIETRRRLQTYYFISVLILIMSFCEHFYSFFTNHDDILFLLLVLLNKYI